MNVQQITHNPQLFSRNKQYAEILALEGITTLNYLCSLNALIDPEDFADAKPNWIDIYAAERSEGKTLIDRVVFLFLRDKEVSIVTYNDLTGGKIPIWIFHLTYYVMGLDLAKAKEEAPTQIKLLPTRQLPLN